MRTATVQGQHGKWEGVICLSELRPDSIYEA